MGEPEDGQRDLERRNHELSVLNAIARELNRSVDLSDALEFTLAEVSELLGLRTGWIWLVAEDSPQTYLAASRNLPPALAEDPARMDGSGYCYCLDSYRRGDLAGAANVNVLKCTRLGGLVDGTDGLRYHASIPLHSGEEKLGVMNVASPDWQSLSERDLQLLYTIGDLLSIAVERARLFSRSARLGALEERNRLAREIHDTLAQGLAATTLQLESADALLDGGAPEPARTPLRRALSLTQANLEEARRSVLDLRAAPLEDRPLAGALEVLVKAWEAETGVGASFEAVNGARPLPPRVEAALYRVCGEALANVARHAGAEHVTVRLVVTPGRARLAVEDDGRGFDVSGIPAGRHGIVGMRERAERLGGALVLRSAPGGGSVLEATVPLEGL
ncbi:GAF domain-containing protein [Rubrobacter marinus]|uniref:GAF domain-containing protein n=1 Tax=Rubrobacter marinus TaxID=2653852 RepID=A0A6G8PSS1_9ACTN|nr:GAF domain-containing sensor histidine kinase [Rubrobacter marinus]QIN77404.1 GAF domain-containing protein [Rubrobacter marinus]